MQDAPSSSPTWTYLRFNVWGLAAATAIIVLLGGFVKLLFYLIHGPRYPGSGFPGPPPPHGMMMQYWGFGEWHLLAVIMHAVLAGVAAAIFAAVYNTVSFRRAP